MDICARCRNVFQPEQLRRVHTAIRILALPFFIVASRISLREAAAAYCPACRRRMSLVIFFISFLVVIVAALYIAASVFGWKPLQPPG